MQTQKKYLIIGCGLIGGSIAKKLRLIDKECIIHYNDIKEINNYAINGKQDNSQVYDYVFLCVPLYFTAVLPLSDNTIVIDMSSLAKLDRTSYAKVNPKYIGFHPMVGSEKSGFENSSETLFDGCNFSLIRYESWEKHKEILSKIEPMIRQITNSTSPIVSAIPEDHNRNVAYTSHLLHFLALKMPKFAELPYFNRISQSNKEMWEDLFKKNEVNIMKALEDFMSHTMLSINIFETYAGNPYGNLSSNSYTGIWFDGKIYSSLSTTRRVRSFEEIVQLSIKNLVRDIPEQYKGTALKEVLDYVL